MQMAGPISGVPVERKDMIALARGALDLGVTFFDTAEAYGPFISEEILGEAFQGVRDQVVIGTKFGWNVDLEDREKDCPGLNSQPNHIKLVVEGMLKRLRTDRIDLLYQHRVDPKVPIEDVAGAVSDLVKAGKIKHFGLVRGGRQDYSSGPCLSSRSRPFRANIRSFGAVPKTNYCPHWKSSGLASCPSVHWVLDF